MHDADLGSCWSLEDVSALKSFYSGGDTRVTFKSAAEALYQESTSFVHLIRLLYCLSCCRVAGRWSQSQLTSGERRGHRGAVACQSQGRHWKEETGEPGGNPHSHEEELRDGFKPSAVL